MSLTVRRLFVSLLAMSLLMPPPQSLVAQPSTQTSPPLPRQATFGIVFAPVTDSVRSAHHLATMDTGVLLIAVTPQGTAGGLGLRAGDVLLDVDGQRIGSAPGAVTLLSGIPLGREVRVRSSRAGRVSNARGPMRPRALERSATWETIADEVTVDGRRRRVLITRPLAEGRHPVLFLIGGIGGYSLDGPLSTILYGPILQTFADAGWVTVRVDKPGQGDSEGGAITDLLFEDELAGYRATLDGLGRHAFVDTTRIVIFGQSMGGSHASILASETQRVRAVAVYATIGVTWMEYWLETMRRQLELAAIPPGTMENALKGITRATHHVFEDGMLPSEVVTAKPELALAVQMAFGANNTLSGMGVPFFRQLHARNMADHWARVDAPVLVLAGDADFVASQGDHPKIAAYVNATHPGRAEYRLLPEIDHFMNRRASYVESRQTMGQPGEFNPVLSTTLLTWATEVIR